MGGPFAAAAIVRLDGSDGDGIHLLWTAPAGAGYSVDGWDIQRRKAQDKPRVECYTLSPTELGVLHRQLRLLTSAAEITVREAACPDVPPVPPDEPAGDPDPPRRTCRPFGTLEPGRGPNPRDERGLVIEVRDAAGARPAHTLVQAVAGIVGLDCGFETLITLPVPASAVEVTLAHFASPAEVEAFKADGSSAGVVRMSAPRGHPETLRLAGPALARIVVRPPQDETLLLEVCFEARHTSGQPDADVGHEAGPRPGLPTGPTQPFAGPAQPLAGGLRAFGPAAASGRRRCLAYDIRLSAGHRIVEVHACRLIRASANS
jgi:hypothetical protein